MIRSFFRQAADLLEHPEKAPGWSYHDAAILQSQGRGSMALVPIILQIAAELLADADDFRRRRAPGLVVLIFKCANVHPKI